MDSLLSVPFLSYIRQTIMLFNRRYGMGAGRQKQIITLPPAALVLLTCYFLKAGT